MDPILLFVAAILVVAAWFDVATRTIPDWCSIALLVIGIGARLFEGPLAALSSVGLALLVGAGFLFLHARGVIGGGDVKLMVALVAGSAPAAVPDLIVAIAVAGGVLGVLYLILCRVMPRPALRPRAALPIRIALVEANRIARRGPLPYAVAIAAGAIIAGLRADVV